MTMLQDTSTADGAFSHAFKAYQLPIFRNDISARDQNHEKKHHPPWSIASVFQVSCSMCLSRNEYHTDLIAENGKNGVDFFA